MMLSKKVKYGFISLTFLILIISFSLYLSRVFIYEPIRIKIKQNNEYITKGIVIKAVKPAFGSSIISLNDNEENWRINEGYYKEIEVDFDSILFSNKSSIDIEIYSIKESVLINSYKKITTQDNRFVIKNLRERKFFAIVKKIVSLNYNFFVFLLSLSFSLLIISIIKKQSVLQFFNILFPVLIIVWGCAWLILASFYTFPNAEDFSNILQSNGAFKILLNSDDRYFTNFLHGFNPLAWRCLSCYKFIPIISLFLIIYSLYFFINSVFSNKIKKSSAIICAMLIVIMHFSFTPSIVHDLYWMTSSFVYLYSWICLFLWTGLFIRLLKAENSVMKLIYFIAAAILMICSYGTIEMMLLVNPFIIIVFSLIINKYKPNRKNDLFSFIIIAAACTFFILSRASAELNRSVDFVRDSNFFRYIFIEGTKQFVSTIYSWSLLQPMTIAIIIGSTIFLRRFYKDISCLISNKKLILILIGLLFSMYIQTYIYYYCDGVETYPQRVYNFVHWQFLIIVFLIIPLLLVKFDLFLKWNVEKFKTKILTFIFIFSFVQIILSENNLLTIRNEYRKGIYEDYKKEMNERYRVIQNQKNNTKWKCALIDSLSSKPSTIFSKPEILQDRMSSGSSKGYEGFFMIDEIKLKGDTISKFKLIQKYAKK